MELTEGHKIERLVDGKVVWRRSWKEKSDGTHYDEKEEFFDIEKEV